MQKKLTKGLIWVCFLLLFTSSINLRDKYNKNIKDNAGHLIYIGPGERLVYQYYPWEWNKFPIEEKLQLLKLDSLAFDENFAGQLRVRMLKEKYKEKQKHGTPQSKAWGIP